MSGYDVHAGEVTAHDVEQGAPNLKTTAFQIIGAVLWPRTSPASGEIRWTGATHIEGSEDGGKPS